ncbi:MAG TPA: isoprenyl transferase [Armatimonadota bacterium]|nr:isoprenyl transferase [Armatimonadota bacterium]
MIEKEIDPTRVPKHVAVIMDGNGRWATRQGLNRIEGHIQGYKTLRRIVEDASNLGVEVLTTYTFSTENWTRPKEEVDALMKLIVQAARAEIADMQELGVRLMVSGRIEELPDATREELLQDIEATKGNTKMILNLAINYGGRREIVDAARKIARRVAAGDFKPEDIDEHLFSQYLYSPELPDPDLLIRTANEMRISNFLLWEIAYSEIYVTKKLWPEFTKEDLIEAIIDYQGRTRKFGAVVEEKS